MRRLPKAPGAGEGENEMEPEEGWNVNNLMDMMGAADGASVAERVAPALNSVIIILAATPTRSAAAETHLARAAAAHRLR